MLKVVVPFQVYSATQAADADFGMNAKTAAPAGAARNPRASIA
jgi:hypothetical protein